ncbi:MAG: molybdopterin-dependent oxidoreductase, partial [Candidatus Aminicenantes bacterium]|nr:molybdopterin-dependent oxidoreductase [Candidatus Aminicenantes bacterium]
MKKDELDEFVRDSSIGRRDFMKLVGGGIVVAVSLGEASILQEGGQRRGISYPEDFNAYLRIGEDGRVACFTGKIEMGQGAITSLPQMLADELDVPIDSVDMVMGDTDLCPYDMGTFGSMTTRYFGPALRAAAAEARGVLLELAAEKFKAPVDRLAVKDGVVIEKDRPANKVTYAKLAAGKRIERHLVPKPSPKPVAEWTVMGKPFLHRDARDKVTGKAVFAGDVRLPGMLYAKVLRPPAHGAALKRLDASVAREIAGVTVIQDGDLVAVLHEHPDAAENALALLKAEYDIPETKLDDKNIFEHLLAVAPEA